MINIKIDENLLCDLCAPKFSTEACEAIINYLNEMTPNDSFLIGDICISFSEIPSDWADDEDRVIATLSNGNVLIEN